jgi:hypothetical protein
MQPFRNREWPHYDKMHVIMLNVRARGSHAFRATNVALPPPIDEEAGQETVGGMGITEEALAARQMAAEFAAGVHEGGSGNVAGTSSSANMPLDDTLSSTNSTNKRKYSTMSTQAETTSINSGSVRASGSPITSSFTASSDRKGKRSRSASKQNMVIASTSSRIAKAVTPAIAISGMQGSINQLTDVFERSMVTPEDGSVAHRNRAQERMQEVDDGLSTDDKVSMIYLFMNNATAADTYLSLNDSNIRRAWVMRMLAEGEAAM